MNTLTDIYGALINADKIDAIYASYSSEKRCIVIIEMYNGKRHALSEWNSLNEANKEINRIHKYLIS